MNMKKFYLGMLLLPMLMASEPLYNINNLNGWAISKDLFLYIYKLIPEDSTILEFGSGYGTNELARYFKMHSVENDSRWVGKYNSTYIYAPIKHYGHYKWYDIECVKDGLPHHYDLILVDGPLGRIGRIGFFYNLDLFNCNVPIIFDDINRKDDLDLCKKVANKLNRTYQKISGVDGKAFGVILPIDGN